MVPKRLCGIDGVVVSEVIIYDFLLLLSEIVCLDFFIVFDVFEKRVGIYARHIDFVEVA